MIPGEVWFPVDIRHPEEAVIEEMDRKPAPEVEEACARDALPHKVEQLWYFPPVAFDAALHRRRPRRRPRTAATRWREMVSGPGHDSFYTARHVPTSMIFIPCKDGLSHNEAEWAEPAHLEAGANVLLRAVLQMAQAG